jgi:transposase-like protein
MKGVLSNKQKLAAEMMVANPEMDYEEVSQKLGISSMTLYRWRKLPEFQDFSHELCMERFKDLEKIAVQKLLENVKKNNQKAIEYALDYMGYKAAEKVEADVNASIEIDYGE